MNDKLLLRNLIKKCFNYFDEINKKQKKIINKKIIKQDYNNKTNKLIIKFNDNTTKQFDCEILGLFDNINKVWIWGWAIPNNKIKNKNIEIVKELLNYGLNIEINDNKETDKIFIKSILTTSRINIKNYLNFTIITALSTYLIKNKINLLYFYSNEDKELYSTILLIK